MEDQKASATPETHGGITLIHRKSSTYITEYADRTVILLSDAAGSFNVNLVFGRDVAEIKEERIFPAGDQGSLPEGIETFRLDLASITLPAAAARVMAESILQALESAASHNTPKQR